MANRQVLTSIRSSGIPSSSFSSRSRCVHSSAPSRATLLATGVLQAAEPGEITLAPIFDIFDVPAKLDQSSELIRSNWKTRRPNETVNSNSQLPRPPPSTLPAPIIFDGPARPRNLPLSFKRRVEQALNSAPVSTRQTRRHHTPSMLSAASEPLIEMFEGPARITRYSHRQSNHQGRMENRLVFLGLATAVAGAAFLTHDNFLVSQPFPKSKR